MTTDHITQERVLAALNFDPINAAAIGVSVSQGVVTLRGGVHSFEQRVAAERLAHSVPGVRAVANELDLPAGARELQPDDSLIAEAAANALVWYRAVPHDAVQVIVRDGWVTLTGTVARMSERGAAERAIRRLRGVRGISNAVTVIDDADAARRWQL
jgi:osmotically-inducible protein OsmY